jgi:hypothetical protein
MSGLYDMPDMPKACFPPANVLEAQRRYRQGSAQAVVPLIAQSERFAYFVTNRKE